jgi:hypothetical protein
MTRLFPRTPNNLVDMVEIKVVDMVVVETLRHKSARTGSPMARACMVSNVVLFILPEGDRDPLQPTPALIGLLKAIATEAPIAKDPTRPATSGGSTLSTPSPHKSQVCSVCLLYLNVTENRSGTAPPAAYLGCRHCGALLAASCLLELKRRHLTWHLSTRTSVHVPVVSSRAHLEVMIVVMIL